MIDVNNKSFPHGRLENVRVLHIVDGMVDVRSKNCKNYGCGKRSFFGVAGTRMVAYCSHEPKDVGSFCRSGWPVRNNGVLHAARFEWDG